MDFIHSQEPLLTYDDIDFDVLAIQYGELKMLVDIDTIPVLSFSHQKWKK